MNCNGLICFNSPCSCANDKAIQMLKQELKEYMVEQIKELREQFKKQSIKHYDIKKGVPYK